MPAAIELGLEGELGVWIARTGASLGDRQNILKTDVHVVYADVQASLQTILFGVAVVVDVTLAIGRIELHFKVEAAQPALPLRKVKSFRSIQYF